MLYIHIYVFSYIHEFCAMYSPVESRFSPLGCRGLYQPPLLQSVNYYTVPSAFWTPAKTYHKVCWKNVIQSAQWNLVKIMSVVCTKLGTLILCLLSGTISKSEERTLCKQKFYDVAKRAQTSCPVILFELRTGKNDLRTRVSSITGTYLYSVYPR